MKKNNKTASQISTEQISQVLEIANKHKVKKDTNEADLSSARMSSKREAGGSDNSYLA